MLKKELQYDFRKDMLEIHKKNIRDLSLAPAVNEFEIKENMTVVTATDASDVILTAAKDLAGYLYTSMYVSVLIKTGAPTDGDIYIGLAADTGTALENADGYMGYVCEVNDRIIISGADERGCAQAVYFIEDEMTRKHAPFLTKKTTRRKAMFTPRMLHSGYGLDEYPDEHLRSIAHAGRDAILVFVTGSNMTPYGYLDFSELIYRAAKYGIDVYAYSYVKTQMHPDAQGAKEEYDRVFGSIFKECPGFKGIVFVGESIEFASKDERVCKPGGEANSNDVPTGKPRPGWFPCCDFPQWIARVRDSIRKYKADADIVFWTYNWGWAPEKERLELIKNMPTDVSLLVTFEMFERYKVENITEYCSDYTIVFEGPGVYFASEAEAAAKRGIRLYTMANTGGMTWDLGVIPYMPAPHQWIKRYKNMRKANTDWGLCGLMESHHYGFYPSFIGDLSNLALSDTELSTEEILETVLAKHFGKENTEKLDEALKLWSEAFKSFTPSNEDQYGPFRVGPAFPLCFRRIVNVPSAPHAHFGNRIVYPDYPAFPSNDQPRNCAHSLRMPVEIRTLEKARSYMHDGIAMMEGIKNKNNALLRLINMGKFIANTLTTGIHAKKWYITKTKLNIAESKAEANTLLQTLREIGEAEYSNVQATVPLVEADSRLGWEPSMEYIGHKENLEWKLRQLRYVLDKELETYKQSCEA